MRCMMTTRLTQTILLLGLLILAATACIPQTPIPIYVTPTHETTASVTPIPTVGGLAPTETPPDEVEAAAVEESPVATINPAPTRSGTRPGPVIGPNYTPPPTFTPRPVPTDTPRPTRDVTQQPTAGPEDTAEPTNTPAGPDPSGLPGLDPSQMGVQVHTLLEQSDWDEVLRLTDQLELGWVKVQIDWNLLQPDGPDGITEAFRRQELYVENLKQRGMKVLVSVAKAPDWARSNTAESGPPDDPQNLVNFLNLMMNEFGNAIDAIEVWNEPNLIREWQGRPLTGGEYMRYFTPAYQAINAYSDRMKTDPKEPRSTPIIVVTAGLAPTSTSDFSTDDRAYLQQMYSAGLGNFRDNVAIGSHPFPWGNPPDVRCCNAVDGQSWDDNPVFFFANTLEDYRNIMVANGHSDVELWPTEFGWATWHELPGEAPEAWMDYNDKWGQAKNTLRAFQIGQSTDYIGPMFLWNMNFGWLPTLIENRDERAAYSLLVPLAQQERPLYWMIYDAVRPDVQLDRYD
jgi:hypothetical protein